MKKVLWLLLFVYGVGFGQETFPGDNIQLLEGKELKVKEKDVKLQRFGYDGFFTDSTFKDKYLQDPKIFNTPYEKLVNKTFKVISYKESIIYNNKYYILEIYNEEIGTLYFKYDTKYEFKFQFNVVGGLIFPEEYYCNKIEKEKDKFTGAVKYNSPILERIVFYKEKGIIYIRIDIPGSTLNVNEKGVLLLLSDGTKISKPNEKISADYREGYRYSSFFTLNKIEVDRIIKSPITDVRLYIYDAEVFSPQKYSKYLKCIVNIK
jgi:hypothetical protein